MAEELNKNIIETNEDKETDFFEIVAELWQDRRQLITWSLIGAIVGIVVAFSIPREYVTEVSVAPEMQDKSSMSGLGSLASMAGINLSTGDMSDAVYPMLYPDIVNSVPFMTGLFDVKVRMKADKREISLKQYLEDESRSPWWSVIFAFPGKVINLLRPTDEEDLSPESDKIDPFRLSRHETQLVEELRKRISTTVDKKTSVVTIDVKMQDALVSAMLADSVVTRLKEFITAYRTDKARQDLEYIQKLNEEARQNYYDAQQRYADYQDRHHGTVLFSAQTTRERLQNEAQLAFNLYNQTAQKVQMAQAKVQENTPVYTVITPATVPIKPSSPRKVMIMIGFALFCFIACAIWLLYGKPWFNDFRMKNKYIIKDNIDPLSGSLKK